MSTTQERLRALVVHCLNTPLGLHSSACFYADKLVTLSKGASQDVHLLAQAYFASKQYRRALMVLKRDDMHERELRFKYLAARCLAECKDWEECLAMLGDGNDVDCLNSSLFYDRKAEGELGQAVSLHASIYLLRARAYEMLDNRVHAIYWYRQALLKDAYCFEAFSALIEGHMLSAEEELDLVGRLRLHNEDRWMQLLLRAKCKKYNLHDQMEGMLQELEAPCASHHKPHGAHHQHAAPPARPAPATQPQPHLFSPEYAARPVGPVSPIGMHLDDAMTPAEPAAGPQHRRVLAGGTVAATPATATATPASGAPLQGPHEHVAEASGPADLPGPHALAAAGTHGPPVPAAADGADGMGLLGRVPVTPMSTDWHPGDTVASTPEYSRGGVAVGGAGADALAGPAGRLGSRAPSGGGLCATPLGDGGGGSGSDMEADTPGPLRPTPVRTRVGAAPPLLATPNPGATDSLPPTQCQPRSQQQPPPSQDQLPQRQQQPGAGSSGRGGGCGLRGNVDVIACRADWLYHRRAYEACLNLTSTILDSDPYALQCLPIHLAACVALGRKAELYMRGHKLVEEYPDRAVAWFAVGCYYMCTKQYEQARRYLGKATGLEPTCAVAWIAFGHAFSAQDERDQAMTAYRTAFRLFPGLHLAALGMGMEYSQMGNLQLAERMLLAAHQLCPADPATCHELGVLNHRNGQYEAATTWLYAALNLVPMEAGPQPVMQGGKATFESVAAIAKFGTRLSSAWEPTVLALGHCLRKQWRWAEALQLYSLALALCPGQPGTFAALGYTHQLMGCLPEAIKAYHSALAIRPDDSFTVDMLNTALEEYSLADI